VAVALPVLVPVDVPVLVPVVVPVDVPVAVAVAEAVEEAVELAVAVAVAVWDELLVAVPLDVLLLVSLDVAVPEDVAVPLDVAVLLLVAVDVRDTVGVAEGQFCCSPMLSSPTVPSSADPSLMDSATQATVGSHTPMPGLATPPAVVASAKGILEYPATASSRCLWVASGPTSVLLPCT
jgi:hypothetical protein